MYRSKLTFILFSLILTSCQGPSPTVIAAQVNTDSPTIVQVEVDVNKNVHPISPLIYGVSAAPAEYLQALHAPLNSWGGNPSTTYNWTIGHAWNAGSDWFYRNGNYDIPSGSASDGFVEATLKSGAEVRLALPALGWVAKDDQNNTCSFPLPGGGCGDANKANCHNPGLIADPNRAYVRSDPNSIRDWLKHLFEEKGFNIRFLAVDNEPELWGYTHYDIHPSCTTYQEILDKYLAYAAAAHEVAPQAELAGPVTCCWYFYWNSAAGLADKLSHGNQDFLPWFLDSLSKHDAAQGWRSLDVLDIHYYPEGLFNDKTDPDTAARRLRSTRSLWDPKYVDESWIGTPVSLIPRMQKLIAEHYPGARLGLSEWNWGADKTMNGALAIADVLGIFGREGVDYAAYWTYPPFQSPGFYAFKLYTNYDDHNSRFGDESVSAQSSNSDWVSSYGALDRAKGTLNLMLINKHPYNSAQIKVNILGFIARDSAVQYQYEGSHLDSIEPSKIAVRAQNLETHLPPYSITLLVISPQ